MITQMRKKLLDDGSNGVKIILWLILASFALPALLELFTDGFRRVDRTGQVAALTINDTTLDAGVARFALYKQEERIELVRQQLGESADMYLPMLKLNDPVKLAKEALIRHTLLYTAARGLNITIPAEFVREHLSDSSFVIKHAAEWVPYTALDKQLRVTMQALEHVMRQYHMTFADVQKLIEEGLLGNLLIHLVGSTAFVSENQLKELYAQQYLAKKISAITLSAEQYKKNIHLTDEEIRAFYDEQNKSGQRYLAPERRSAVIWQFDPQHYGITVSDEKIQNYYERNKYTEFVKNPAAVEVLKITISIDDKDMEAAKKEAEDLRAQLIVNPSGFAKRGALPEKIEKGKGSAAVERAVFSLEKDGDITPVISTDDALVIMQRTARKKIEFTTLEEVKKELTNRFLQESFQDRFMADVQPITRRGTDQSQALECFVEEKKGVKTVLNETNLLQQAPFSYIFQVRAGERQGFVDANRGFIIEVTNVTKSSPIPLETIQARVKNDAIAQKVEKTMQEDINRIRAQLGEQSLQALATEVGGTFYQSGWISKEDATIVKELQSRGISLKQVGQLAHKHDVVTSFGTDTAVVIQLDEFEQFNTEDYKEKRGELYTRAVAEEKSRIGKGFIASLYKHATITINDSSFRE